MDDLQQRMIEIALQIPGYLGYEAKERRRDVDKYTRGQLALKYSELQTVLARVRAKAPLAIIVDLERLDQKLSRLIARFNTAPRGYAGWFDSAQIVEADIDALTKFDADLANGVPGLKAAFDKLAAALKAQNGMDDAIAACGELLDNLNAEFDQREQFMSTGKRPTLSIAENLPPTSPLDALEAKRAPTADFVAVTNLKLNDALSFGGGDYLVAGKLTFKIPAGTFWAFLLKDGGKQLWLRVGPGEEIATCQEVKYRVPSPLPDALTYDNQNFTRADAGQASVTVEGAGGSKRGTVNYARYIADAGSRLWIDDFGAETRVLSGITIDPNSLKLYRR
jgi:hypothetical protein